KMLVDGVDVQYRRTDGSIKDDTVKLVDFSNLKNNEFLAVNQFTVKENGINKRTDIVLFVNGLPLVVIELKNPAEEKADKATAYAQMQRYLREISTLFHYNEIIIISDGVKAWAGTISSDIERFMEWKAIDGKVLEELDQFSRDTLILDMLRKEVIIDLVRHFITFEKEKSKSSEKIIKKLAAYHQYYAVLAALKSTIEAASPSGDKRAGIIWHTQGSGKSLTMAFYTGKIVDAMGNPTIVVITDRNDLDDQLFETFCKCSELLRNMPKQAATKQALKEFLKVASGGIVFTTAQKFLAEAGEKFPLLSGRRDIVVIADEAHRSQYDFIDGFARHMRDALPNASFIGFTATPIETNDRSTTAVFGGCKDIYDMKQSVNDGMTVQIYYENRLAKIGLKTERMPKIESDFKEITEAEETETKEKLKTKWARMEKVVGAKKRIRHIAEDIVSHFEQRQAALDGKGLIVCMSRRICIDLHDAIVKLRPEWYSKEHDKGAIKVVITGAA
ncbi:TPA: type I restriction endonuclease subunit R, partial [Candidatus Micrarchaeota archaeon]|nr:type I restriction endonuclease subunit R [Candidatus Micrarchaeota archaeon]